MDETQARAIAREVFWQFYRCKTAFPSAYEFIAAEVDLTDDEFLSAIQTLFPEEAFD